MSSIRAALASTCGIGVFGVAFASSAEEPGQEGRPTREYRLVATHFEQSRMEHARVVRTFVTRAERSGSFTVGLSAGARSMGLSELNLELRGNGYSTVGTRGIFGAGAAWFGPHAFLGLLFEGGPNTIRSVDGIEGNVGYFDLLLQGGPAFDVGRAAILYPYVGFGLAGMNVLARTNDPARTPILNGRLPALPKGLDVNAGMGVVELGLGALVSLPVADTPADRYGVALGTEIGYSVSFAESDWRDGTVSPDPPSYGGLPSHGVHGATVRLLLRYVYDGFVVTRERRPMQICNDAACRVVCDEGFADCDGDPANGCETELGTEENCGACGDACMVRRGLGTCGVPANKGTALIDDAAVSAVRRECAIAACEPGFMNCNGRTSDGCETPVRVDPYNCGACGHLCTPLERCTSGACVPREEPDGAL